MAGYFAVAGLLVHLLTNGGYGYFRDGLYLLACADHRLDRQAEPRPAGRFARRPALLARAGGRGEDPAHRADRARARRRPWSRPLAGIAGVPAGVPPDGGTNAARAG